MKPNLYTYFNFPFLKSVQNIKLKSQGWKFFLTTLLFVFCSLSIYAQLLSLGGTIYSDANNNGMYDDWEIPISGVIVKVYSRGPDGNWETGDDLIETTVLSNIAGGYRFYTTNTGTFRVRIEGTNFLAGGELETYGTSSTTTSNTANNDIDDDDNGVQAAPGTVTRTNSVGISPGNEPPASVDGDDTNSNSTVDFGFVPDIFFNDVFTPSINCETINNPPMITTCYANGINIGNTIEPAVIKTRYNLNQVPTYIAYASQVGSVYGVAHHYPRDLVFAAAFLKSHVGFGPEGMDAIYILDPENGGYKNTTDPTIPIAINLSDFGINVGTLAPLCGPVTLNSGACRDLKGDDSFDNWGMRNQFKIGLGDMAISPDGRTLYIMNLNDHDNTYTNGQLVILDISDIRNIKLQGTVDIPDLPACAPDEVRPFAMDYDVEGERLVIGVTCSAQNSQLRGRIRTYMYELNAANTGFTLLPVNSTHQSPIASNYIPLNYQRGSGYTYVSSFPVNNINVSANFEPWTDDFLNYPKETVNNPDGSTSTFVHSYQPLLTDIEILDDGSMVLAWSDRGSWQIGHNQRFPGITGYAFTSLAGEILKVHNTASGYLLEGHPSAPASNHNTGNGPGGTEFFNDIHRFPTSNEHHQTAMGSLAYKKGAPRVMSSRLNPRERNIYNEGGIGGFLNDTGVPSRSLLLYTSKSAGKSPGIGEMTPICGCTELVSVGSTVFADNNNNGIMDGSDAGIPNVVVELIDPGKDAVFGTTDDFVYETLETDAFGNYFFDRLPQGQYKVRIPASEFTAGEPLEEYLNSSTTTITVDDNGAVDGDDNGIQTGGKATQVLSPAFTLAADTEKVNETGQGGVFDDGDDDNGDMTIDFGLYPRDSDNDLLPDVVDIDDDNDGIPDLIEVPLDPFTDADGDDIPVWLDDDDSNPLIGNVDMASNPDFDFDGDGVPNNIDLDADGDGISDIIEAGGIDTDGDAMVDYPTPGDPTSMTDIDRDGLSDDPILDTDDDGIADLAPDDDLTGPTISTTLPIFNTDGVDGPDFLDLDSDNDGILDNIEAFNGANYFPPTNMDADRDGLDDAYDGDNNETLGVIDGPGTAIDPVNTDSDSVPDYRDLDADNDGLNDIEESGGTDINGDGLVDIITDQGTTIMPWDDDNDDIPNFQEIDSNNDGLTDISESTLSNEDTNGDGIIDSTIDPDGDGIMDVADGKPTVFGDAPRGVILTVKLLLEGPYNQATGLMNDNLNTSGLLPTMEPYTAFGYQHAPGYGGEIADPGVFDVTGPDAIVDWAFVELRSSIDFTQTVATRTVLLQADGDLVDMDGVSPIYFADISAASYYIVAKHRNHLDVMTPGALPLNEATTLPHDFSTGSAFGVITFLDVQKVIGPGVFGLYACDFNQSGSVDAADRSISWNARNQTGYLLEDSNFDGVCDAAERSATWNNRNKLSRVP